jgi:hypothetical protein
VTTLRLRIVGSHLPGRQFAYYQGVHPGIQRRTEVIDVVPGDTAEATFDLAVEAGTDEAASLDFRGPYVRGKRGECFPYLTWGNLAEDGTFTMFRNGGSSWLRRPELRRRTAER